MEGYVLNPDDEFVSNLKYRIRDNGGYCLYSDKKSKKDKCPKACKLMNDCPCGMYIKEFPEGPEFDLD